MNLARYCSSLLLVVLLTGCAQYESERGVEVNWDAATMSAFERGVSTRADVMAALGPPSQLVSLGDETVLYYLNESSQGEGLILLVYNRFDVNARYDRAVFIFDENDRLTDYSAFIAPEDER
jgi:outer membrane protein assembly factor BamE (lipoprotein component of BamABCDE complex)